MKIRCPYCNTILRVLSVNSDKMVMKCKYCCGVFAYYSHINKVSYKTKRDHYEVLDLDINANEDAIKEKFRELIHRIHPDKNPENQIRATKLTQSLNEAYSVLSDPVKKTEYDNLLFGDNNWNKYQKEEPVSKPQYENHQQDWADYTSSPASPKHFNFLSRIWAVTVILVVFMLIFGITYLFNSKKDKNTIQNQVKQIDFKPINEEKQITLVYNLKIEEIINDRSSYYKDYFKTIGEELSQNVKSIAKYMGKRKDKKGRLVNYYLYKNEDLDRALFLDKWKLINVEYEKLKLDISKGNIAKTKTPEIMNYFKTVFFFAANELWFRSYDQNDLVSNKSINIKIIKTMNDQYMNQHLISTNEMNYAEDLKQSIIIASRSLQHKKEIKNLKSEINNYESSEEEELYKISIDHYNDLVDQYNAEKNSVETLFSKFINLVDIYLIFPGQETIEQTSN